MAIGLLSRFNLSSQPASKSLAEPTLASCGNNPERYVKAMEQHFAGDGAKLYAHVAGLKQSNPQSTDLRAAFIDGSEALRDFLGIRNPNGIRKRLSFGSSSPRISASDAPAGLVMAATHSTEAKRVQRSLARLEEELKANPPLGNPNPKYLYSVGTALGDLMQDLHKLPTKALQQKAVEIIGQHLPQLNIDARKHIQSLAKAMERENIGNELKASLQDLIQSKGQATLGALLKKEDSPQPKRTDNSGRGSFTSILKNSTTAPSKSGIKNPASRPYAPIKLKTYSGYGSQNKVQVQCTDYARQASELLIDKNGELDGAHISLMLNQLKTDKTMPAEHRRHLMRTLVKLKQGGELAETINSICEDKPLKGGAADVVRGTLNLPPEHELTKEDARKAFVMSLLGYLRQGEVGSCFATAPAICLLDSSQEVVAKDMKELLEDHKLTFQQDGALVEVPLNLHVSQAAKVTVAADGTCDSLGMQAALAALGIPENKRQAAIANALSQMKLSGRQHTVNCKQIIEHLVRTTPGTGNPDNRIASALHAFNGRQDVGLLRAWEYTLATCADMDSRSNTRILLNSLRVAFWGKKEIPGRPELLSPAEEGAVIADQLCSDPRFDQIEPHEINQYLFNEIRKLFQERFIQQFDVNVSDGNLAADGVSRYGGFTLYEKRPADNPSEWKRIDNAEAFQEAMASLAEDAAERVRPTVETMADDPETKLEALRLIADHVVASVRDSTFIEHAVLQMNPDAANQPFGDANQYNYTPWQLPESRSMKSIIDKYGGEVVLWGKISPTADWNMAGSAPSSDATQSKANDAMPLINFFCGGLDKMAPKLQAKAQESPGGFKIPVANVFHVFSLMPMEMKEIWSDNPVTPEEWVENNLKSPTNKWLNEARTSPPLLDMLKSVGAEIHADPKQIQSMYRDIHEKSKKSGRLNFKEPPYTLRDVHEKLSAYCRSQENGDELLAKAEKVLTDKLPIPAKTIADTNWLEQGHPEYIGVLYNPFSNNVEAEFMRRDGTGRSPMKEDWFNENVHYIVHTPLASKTNPQVNNQ